MEKTEPQLPMRDEAAGSSDSLSAILHDQRRLARQVFMEHREKIKSVETKVVTQIQQLVGELDRERDELQQKVALNESMSSDLNARKDALEQREQEFLQNCEARRVEVEDACSALLAQLRTQLDELAVRRKQLDDDEQLMRKQVADELQRVRSHFESNGKDQETLGEELKTKLLELGVKEQELYEQQQVFEKHRSEMERRNEELLAQLGVQLEDVSKRRRALDETEKLLRQRVADEIERNRVEHQKKLAEFQQQTEALERLSREIESRQADLKLREREIIERQNAWDQHRTTVERTCADLLKTLSSQLDEISRQQVHPQASAEAPSLDSDVVQEMTRRCEALLDQLAVQLEEVAQRRAALEKAERDLQQKEQALSASANAQQLSALEEHCRRLLEKLGGRCTESLQILAVAPNALAGNDGQIGKVQADSLQFMAGQCQELLDQLGSQVKEVKLRQEALEHSEQNFREREEALKASVYEAFQAESERRCEELLAGLHAQFHEYWSRTPHASESQPAESPQGSSNSRHAMNALTLRCQNLVDQLGSQLEEVSTRRRALDQTEKRLREKELALKDAVTDRHCAAIEHRCEELLGQLSGQLNELWQQHKEPDPSTPAVSDAPAKNTSLDNQLAERYEQLLTQLGAQLEELTQRRNDLDELEAGLRKQISDEAERNRSEHHEKSASHKIRAKELTTREEQLAQRERVLAERQAACGRHHENVERACEEALSQFAKNLGEFFSSQGEGPAQIQSTCEILQKQLGDQIEELAKRRAELQQCEDRLRTREAELLKRFEQHANERGSRESSSPANASPSTPVAKTVATAPPRSNPPSGTLDWEALKKQLLTQMESDGEADVPSPASDDKSRASSPAQSESVSVRQRIDEIIEKTNRIITVKDRQLAEKDQQIAERDQQIVELEALLKNQSAQLGGIAVGASAIAQMIDHDAIIQEEREALKRLQEDWHGKLRKAELEISVERAKLARERVALEEQIRKLEAERESYQSNQSPDANKNNTAKKGRWLARLGLSDEKDK